MIDWLIFAVLAFFALGGAVRVVTSENLVHVVLYLAVTLIATAGVYAQMDAGFLAAIQILLYTGGVITLMLFAVLLARRNGGSIPAEGHTSPARSLVVAALVAALSGYTILSGGAPKRTPETLSTAELGRVLLDPLALPFEALSVLLLAAMIGAIVLARRKDA